MVEPAGALPPCPHCGKDHAESVLKCPDTDMMLPLRGRLLDGKFRLLEPIGKGGMAEVWLAVNIRVDRSVAIKLIRPEVARDDSLVGRFRAEARAAGRIGHRDICDILDSGVSPIGPFIVMELLRGRSLGDVITRRGPLPHGAVVAVVRQALEGLQAAHAAGIVHRDLKPENVFLHRNDRGQIVVKLMDFGVAKFTDGTGEVTTEHGALLGTPEYMAPEQFKGAMHADVRTDVWALGAILYRAFTGHNAFSGPTIAAILLAVSSEPPKPMRERAPDVPPRLASIVMRCLAKAPGERYATVGELSAALAPFDGGMAGVDEWLEDPPEPTTAEIADDLGVDDVSDAPELVAPDDAVESEPQPTVPRQMLPPLPPRPWAWIALGVALSFGGSFGVYEVTRERPAEEEEEEEDEEEIERRADNDDHGVADDDPTPTTPAGEPPPVAEEPRREPQEGTPPPEPTTGVEATPPPPPEQPSPSTPVRTPESTPPGSTSTTKPTTTPTADPAGVIRVGTHVTPVKQAPVGNHRQAKAWCDGLARTRYLGIASWQMPNPATATKFTGKAVKKGRYWTSALHHGRALVIALPGGEKDSVVATQRRARPLCTARWP